MCGGRHGHGTQPAPRCRRGVGGGGARRPQTSRLVGRRLHRFILPDGASVGAIVRGDAVLMAHHQLQVETGDHLIVFVANKRLLPKVENCSVGFGFW